MPEGLRGAALLVALALMLAAWVPPARADDDSMQCPARLPAVVAAKRDAITAAARTGNLARLKALSGPGEFEFSYGGDEDALVYWQGLRKLGTDIGPIIVALLAMPCAVQPGPSYVWPSAAAFDWPQLSAGEQRALGKLYGKSIDDYWVEGRAKGYYIGWRLFISRWGAWTGFVAGD